MEISKPVLMPMKTDGKKRMFDVLLKNQVSLQRQIQELMHENMILRKLVEAEVERQMGETVKTVNSALDESIIHKKIFMEKGLFTREELNEMYGRYKK